MSLRDDMAADLDVFFNPDEFGDEHLIDGVKVLCMIDASEGQQFSSGEEVSVWADSVSLYAKTADLKALPEGLPIVGKKLVVDRRAFLVISVNDEAGVTKVVMELLRS